MIQPQELITAIRARVRVVAQRHPAFDLRQISPKQLQIVNIALGQIVGHDRDVRIRILAAIFPEGLDCSSREPAIVQLTSSKHLTMAQGGVLIELLYRLTEKDSFEVGRPLYQKAVDFFGEMVNWTKQAYTQEALF